MPTFNLSPILFPKRKEEDIYNYDLLKDLIDIGIRQRAIDEGGELRNPDSLDEFINQYRAMENNPQLSGAQRIKATKARLALEQQQVKLWLDKKKEMDEKGIDWMLTQDLREVEFALPENPYAYAMEAQIQIGRLLDGTAKQEGLNDVLIALKAADVNTVRLEEYRNKLENEELNKYARIQRAFEEKDPSLLSEYAVIYTPFNNKVGAMEIINVGTIRRSYMHKTNLKFSVDEAGKLVTVSGDQLGMPIYFIRANASTGDKYSFAGLEFDYTEGLGFETKKPKLFDWQNIKHTTIGEVPPGKFVRDSKKNLYYVNQDWTYSPVKNESFKEELGFQEDKVYNLNPVEELNVLPGAIEYRFPLPIRERYDRETEMAGQFSYKKALGKEYKKPLYRPLTYAVPEAFKLVKPIVKPIGRRIAEFAKESWKKTEREKREIPEKPSWNLEEVGKLPSFEEARGWLKKLGI